MKRVFSLVALILCTAFISRAKVSPAPIFADNMVLQQKTDAALWGKARPNSKLVITTTWSKAKTVVKADTEGKWFTRISTPEAGGPYEITFNDGEKLTLKNILVGEVWICAGQSNMAQQMKGYMGQPVEGAADIISEANAAVPIRSCNLARKMAFTPEEDCDATWYVNDPAGVAEASAAAYFFARKIHAVLGVPVGIINASWGSTAIESWMNPVLLEKEFAEEIDLSHLKNRKLPEVKPHQTASVLYNGMLHSIIPFTAKGFLWYQGCHNRMRYEQYKRLQPAFVKMLREEWGDENMPFYFTQIAPYQYNDPDKPHAGYMMWAQAQTLKMIPHSGMATTHDVGEKVCIHPAKKKPVGDRLAYLALANDYGIKGIDAIAPMPAAFEFKEGAAFVTFDCGKMGLGPINQELGCFELAGEDRVFHLAVAVVQKDRKSILVTSPEVSNPIAVRYGMKNWSKATLFNNFGIPASPFRSDNWE